MRYLCSRAGHDTPEVTQWLDEVYIVEVRDEIQFGEKISSKKQLNI